MLKRPEFAQSRETQAIYEIFVGLPQRESMLVTYAELLKATERKTITEIRGFISTAIRRARRDHSIVIECDRMLGYRVRLDAELADCGTAAIERGRRIHKTGLEKVDCVDVKKLSSEEKTKFFVVKTALELSLIPSRPRTRANITQQVIRKHNSLTEEEKLQVIRDSLSK